MPTGQVIANNVLTKLGLNDSTGVAGPSDSQYFLNELNNMWNSASIDEGMIYAVVTGQYPLTAYQQSYAIGVGSGADFSTQRPARIYRARVVDSLNFTATTQTSKTVLASSTAGLAVGMNLFGAGIAPFTTILSIVANTSIGISIAATASASSITLTATGLDRNDIDVIDARAYYDHNDLGAQAATPDEVYPDYNPDTNGNMRLYLWPVVNEFQASYIELEQAVNFLVWALTTNYNIPAAYQDWIEWTVAFRCLPGFGMAVPQQNVQVIVEQSTKAEARIREMNAFNRKIPQQAVMAPGSQNQPPAAPARP